MSEPSPQGDPAVERARLRWQCRRGLRELDILLKSYLDTRYPSASDDERKAFADLLQCTDYELMDWILGHANPPDELVDVVRAITPSY